MADYDHDDYYVRNRRCSCLRCASRSLMGPAVLITIGVLFLLDRLGIFGFGRGIPILLIVIGLIQVAQRSAPTTGHVQPAPYYPPGTYPPGTQPPSPPTIEGIRPNSEVNRG